MKRYFALFLTLFSVALASGQSSALLPGLYEAESTSLQPYYSGSGWVEVADGDFVVMETSVSGDSVSFVVSGSQLVIYRNLLASGGATAEICVNALCSTFTNASSVDQRSVPIAFPVQDGDTVTITNSDGGTLDLDSFLLLAGPELTEVPAPDPVREYHVLPDGEIVGVDRVISGGEIVVIAFGAAQIVLLLILVVVVAWKK